MGMFDKISKINSKAGVPVVTRGNEKPWTRTLDTGIFALDYAYNGGFAEGYCNALIGYPSSGKSTISLRAIGAMQKKYPDSGILLVDFEGTYDANWAAQHGVDLDRLAVVQPTIAETGLNVMKEVIRERDCKMVVVDSLAQIIPQEEYEKKFGEQTWGLRAKMVGKTLNEILLTSFSRMQEDPADTLTAICINQWRINPKALPNTDPRTLPGGEQQGFAFFTRVEFGNVKRISAKDDDEDKAIHHTEHSFIVKKYKGPMSILDGKWTMQVMPGEKIQPGTVTDFRTAINYGRKHNVITGSGPGGYLVFGIKDKFKTLDSIEDFMYENPDQYNLLKARIIGTNRENNGLTALPQDGFLCGMYHPKGLELP
jgi:RecA/RadA recombinase